MDVHEMLLKVQRGEVDLAEAEDYFKKLPYEDIGCAKIDHHRGLRSGFGEVIYSPGKTLEHMVKIFQSFADRQENVLATRASREQFEAVHAVIPEVVYEEASRTICLQYEKPELIGNVVVCTGGTTDIPVAEEAARTAEFFGSRVNRIFDVGVAGIHRLIARLEDLRAANAIVAVAGMEGALPGVVAGLVEHPVIAVPTSVGYGAGFHGLAPLLTMLNSCAEGIAVVNIDNGFGAGYMATQINRLAVNGNTESTISGGKSEKDEKNGGTR